MEPERRTEMLNVPITPRQEQQKRHDAYYKVVDQILDRLQTAMYLSRTQLRVGIQDERFRLPFEFALFQLQNTGILTRLFDTSRHQKPGYHPELYCLTKDLHKLQLPEYIKTYAEMVALYDPEAEQQ